MRAARALRAEDHQVFVEVTGLGDDDGAVDTAPGAAPAQAKGGALSRGVVVAGHDEAGDAWRRGERAQATGGERGGGGDGRNGGDHGEHRLDALPHRECAGVGVAEADGMAVDTAEGLARKRHGCLRGLPGIEPCPMNADDGRVIGAFPWTGVFLWTGAFLRARVFPWTGALLRVGGDGCDEGRQAAHAAAVTVEERGMEAERGEAAAVDGACPEVGLGVRAVDCAAALPQAARRLTGIVRVGRARCRRSRQGEEGAGLGHGVAERHAAHAVADEVEEVAVRPLRGVGPLAGDAGGARRTKRDRPRAP